jgi:hypothetical protein
MDPQQQQIDELKARLAALSPQQESDQPVDQQPIAGPVPSISAAMESLLAGDFAEEQSRIDAINSREKACESCYRRQSVANHTCELCNAEPVRWLPSAVAYPSDPQDAGKKRRLWEEHEWRKWIATSATIEHLQHVVSRSSAPGDGWKIKHAARILRLRGETVPHTFWGEIVDCGEPLQPKRMKQPEGSITDEQVASALKFCDLQLERLQYQAA